jgi:hypothetical protein
MAHVVRNPQRFDVIVTTNMYGDILSDLTAELSGSLGLAASLNAGADHGMAQAAHGSAPDIAGKNVANPLSLILSAAMLLAWHGRRNKAKSFEAAAAAIEKSVETAIAASESTADIGGRLDTRGPVRGRCARARVIAAMRCDSHVHIVGPVDRYPQVAERTYLAMSQRSNSSKLCRQRGRSGVTLSCSPAFTESTTACCWKALMRWRGAAVAWRSLIRKRYRRVCCPPMRDGACAACVLISTAHSRQGAACGPLRGYRRACARAELAH